MCRELFHVYGPLSINSFGVMIAIGIITNAWLLIHHRRRPRIMSGEQFIDLLLVMVFTGLIGSRFLAVVTNLDSLDHWLDIFKFWEGGYSVLGAMLGNLFVIPWYLKRHAIPALPCMDLIALHLPLLYAFTKIGCFFAGCCYGKPTDMPWAICYTDSQSVAPLGICIHPTQLYSAFIYLCVFGIFYCLAQNRLKKPGQLFALFLVVSGFERFVMDFFRDDQEFFSLFPLNAIAIYQWIALSIAVSGLILFYVVSTQRSDQYS